MSSDWRERWIDGRLAATWTLLGVCVGLLLVAGNAHASTIVVPGTALFNKAHTIAPLTELRPSQCLPVQGIVNLYTGGTFGASGGGASVLYLGSEPGSKQGGNGDDCNVPGAITVGTFVFKGGGGNGSDTCYDSPSGPVDFDRQQCETLAGTTYSSNTTSNPSFT